MTSNKTYIDVFDEIDIIRSTDKIRRFSFSIPNDDINNNKNDLELLTINSPYEPPTPPPSPELISYDKSSIVIQIPDSDDFNLYLDTTLINSSDSEDDTLISDIQPFLNYSKKDLLIYSERDLNVYKKPPRKSFDARKIWKQAKIPKTANIYIIESLLLDWAFSHAYLEIKDKKIKKIKWISKSQCRCESTWHAFLKWIVCSTVSA